VLGQTDEKVLGQTDEKVLEVKNRCRKKRAIIYIYRERE
jgi:hypothetical protein